MDRATYERAAAINRQAYERLRDQIRREYAGQYVALACGRVVGASPSYDLAEAAVRRLEPMPEVYHIFAAEMEPCFELSHDVSEFPVGPFGPYAEGD